MVNAHNIKSIALSELQRKAPAAFAEHPHFSRSKNYKFVSTCDLLESFQQQGWIIIDAMQSNVRDKSKAGYQRHMVTLAHGKLPEAVGDTLFTANLINSHDGTSSWQLLSSFLRLICGNGAMAPESIMPAVRFNHSNVTSQDVLDAQDQIIEQTPKLREPIRQMTSIILTEQEQIALARASLEVRWNQRLDTLDASAYRAPISPQDLNLARRSEDIGNDLWRTFNRIQENILRGGILGRATTGRKYTTKAVQGVSETVRLNREMWQLAETMRQLKS